MNSKALDKIIYPGSDQYSTAELAAPGSIPVELGDEPLIKAIDTAYILFEVPDLERQTAFLEDFGMVPADCDGEIAYFRGYGSSPYIYAAHQGKRAGFLGAGFLVASEADLQKVASACNRSIEAVDGPGGGLRVRLHDPDGFIVDLVWDRARVEPLETRREPLPYNFPNTKHRRNSAQRPSLEPSAVERFGHYVLMVSDFADSWAWYRHHLGLLPTDVQCTTSGQPVLAFCRLDRGDECTDHHTVVLTSGPAPGCLHSAYEVLDLDSIGQGQQHLKQRGWKHFWGIGRHILGSQIFDYWLDPFGQEMEHYADGDVFDSHYPTQYHLMDRGGLWAWGDDVPAAMKPKPGLGVIVQLLSGGAAKRKLMLEMKQAMDRLPRPWLK